VYLHSLLPAFKIQHFPALCFLNLVYYYYSHSCIILHQICYLNVFIAGNVHCFQFWSHWRADCFLVAEPHDWEYWGVCYFMSLD
jgi:hypothetical protein